MVKIPSHKLHKLVDKILLGKEYPEVHKFADLVLGKGHRKKWGHGIEHTALLYLISKDKKKKAISHLAHVFLDKLETKNKALFDLLELYLLSKKRKKNRY